MKDSVFYCRTQHLKSGGPEPYDGLAASPVPAGVPYEHPYPPATAAAAVHELARNLPCTTDYEIYQAKEQLQAWQCCHCCYFCSWAPGPVAAGCGIQCCCALLEYRLAYSGTLLLKQWVHLLAAASGVAVLPGSQAQVSRGCCCCCGMCHSCPQHLHLSCCWWC